MRALYISHNGMLEGLGRAQVLPYLKGLGKRGVAIDLLSFELAGSDQDAISTLASSLVGSGVRWTPLVRKRDSRLRVKVEEAAKGVTQALRIAIARRPDIVHGRNHLPTAIADVIATMLPRARLVFDCRGLLGDENVDAGHWTKDRIEYRLVKRYEAHAFRRADGVVVLTDALRRMATDKGWFGRAQVEVIPCCVDTEAFRFDADERSRMRRELGLGDRCVLVYAGSLGSWYREADIARVAGIAKKRAGKPISFLLLTPSKPDALVALLRENGLLENEIVVRSVRPNEMPSHVMAADVGVSFIMSCFSKIASSPTKVAEYLACGLPVILNGDIGDQADLAVETQACVVVQRFSDDVLVPAVDKVLSLSAEPIEARVRAAREVATRRFGLEEVGVARYEHLYESVVSKGLS